MAVEAASIAAECDHATEGLRHAAGIDERAT
jgi:hypothetical protein